MNGAKDIPVDEQRHRRPGDDKEGRADRERKPVDEQPPAEGSSVLAARVRRNLPSQHLCIPSRSTGPREGIEESLGWPQSTRNDKLNLLRPVVRSDQKRRFLVPRGFLEMESDPRKGL